LLPLAVSDGAFLFLVTIHNPAPANAITQAATAYLTTHVENPGFVADPV
jgi:hypothetical protein